MTHNTASKNEDPNPLLLELTDQIEAQGYGPFEYEIYESVDPEALNTLVSSLTGEYTLNFSVEDLDIEITQDGLTVHDETT